MHISEEVLRPPEVFPFEKLLCRDQGEAGGGGGGSISVATRTTVS